VGVVHGRRRTHPCANARTSVLGNADLPAEPDRATVVLTAVDNAQPSDA
jgi:hypothetical protein